MSWLADLRHNPVPPLINSGHAPVQYWSRRDLLRQAVPKPKDVLWDQAIPQGILRKQRDRGCWSYPGRRASPAVDYDQLETYRQLGFLIEMFGFNREHSSIARAAEYIFSCQHDDGDIRGIYALQYTPNYTAALLELLVKAGYEDDERTSRAFTWLEDHRQLDGGWALAFRTQGYGLGTTYGGSPKLELDRSKPFSHLVTGVVLRAFAAHPEYRTSSIAKNALALLVPRFFERDAYPDRSRKEDWTRFSFPFWQTDILSSLDVAGLIEPRLTRHAKVQEARQWFCAHQRQDGLFTGRLLRDRYHDLQLWYSYAVCRAFARFATE